ncbi:MAG: FlgD immunoglobulin-like domain containing protein [Candidatus Latescibacteria bacterium]|nr:FlgD immunoglobulin-like domain containing protein [Candidatus Latescibacterota bacterium]
MKAKFILLSICCCVGLLVSTTNVKADCITLDVIEIGNPTSEAGHGLQHWGPIEPATSGGNYGGADHCRPVYAVEDGDVWATLDLDFGDDGTTAKCLTIGHLDGNAADSFDLYMYPRGFAMNAELVFSYPGDNLTTEIWLETRVAVHGTGVQTLKFVSTAPMWSGWATYGQMCFDLVRLEECPPLIDSVDVGDPASETGHAMAGWGPVEPATSGGNYGGADHCRPVYAPEDGDDWATIDLDFGDCIGQKCLTLEHLDGLGIDAFEAYLHPVGQPAAATLIFSYPGGGTPTEDWITSSLLVEAAGVQTLRLVSTEPQWSGWATYGQMCFANLSVESYVPVKDMVLVGVPDSEAGHAMTGWGPIEPATSGGVYGGVDACRAIYAPEDADVSATIELDFGHCTLSQKCLHMIHLDGITKDAFEVYIYAPGSSRPAVPAFIYGGDDISTEVWYATSFAVTAAGVQVVEFVSTEPEWSGWAIYGQVCFTSLEVVDGPACGPTPVFGTTGLPDGPRSVTAPGRITSVTPNPFNPATEISFALDAAADVDLSVFDSRGRLVRVLAHGVLDVGGYTRIWDGADASGRHAASGVYFARLSIAGATVQVAKMSLVQ